MTILVTGSTGRLGAPTIAALFEAAVPVRGLTRHGPGGAIGDLYTGHGIPAALDGIDTVVHCAQTGGAKDIRVAANLIAAARDAGVRHLVLVSIVGIEAMPIAYYGQRLEIEQAVERSGIPFTLQRATQFHELLLKIFESQRRLPVAVVPAIDMQPVAAEEVGHKLAALALGEPRGRVPDIGGPETLPLSEFFGQWKELRGVRKASVPVAVPGALGRAFRAGRNVVPGPAFGRQTFAQFLGE
ncbi:MAG: NmrA family NAD(P)-binding protein, partial [Microbacteriaceae bacterium]|nr:NmrA family NAD(P)-binding protein [Microbacteriaceae bacterium]